MSDARKRAEEALDRWSSPMSEEDRQEWGDLSDELVGRICGLASALRAFLAETAPHETFEGHPHDASCRECWPAPPQAREVEVSPHAHGGFCEAYTCRLCDEATGRSRAAESPDSTMEAEAPAPVWTRDVAEAAARLREHFKGDGPLTPFGQAAWDLLAALARGGA